MTYLVYRTKFLADGTMKQIPTKECETQAVAENKGLSAYANDLIDETLEGSLTIVANDEGGIYFNKRWHRKDYPLSVAVAEVTAEATE